VVLRTSGVINEPLRVRWEQTGHQIVVHAAGDVDLATAPLLVLALSEATAAPGAREVVVDLTKVEFFGAIGLTTLLTATCHGEDTGVPVVVITHPGQPPHRTITLCQLQNELRVIDIPGHGPFNGHYEARAQSTPTTRRHRRLESQ
jgi:anti-sigma B factor antagonist